MRHLRIILLHFEHVFEHRARSFIWFLLALINPLIIILFWRGADKDSISSGITFSGLSTYYFLLIVAVTFLMSHIEEDVAYLDIKQGDLYRYLLRPFSYYWIKFYEEISYRVLQGFYGIVALAILISFFGKFISIYITPPSLILSLVIIAFAFFLSFTFKMVVGLLAFWLTDIGGLFNTMEVVIVIFAGFVLPISLMPEALKTISSFLPFAYMIYFPVAAFQGQFSNLELLKIILTQFVWLCILLLIYKILWISGIRRFTGVGK